MYYQSFAHNLVRRGSVLQKDRTKKPQLIYKLIEPCKNVEKALFGVQIISNQKNAPINEESSENWEIAKKLNYSRDAYKEGLGQLRNTTMLLRKIGSATGVQKAKDGGLQERHRRKYEETIDKIMLYSRVAKITALNEKGEKKL